MSEVGKVSRVLGVAFLLQFITSISSGMFLEPAWLVDGNIGETMLKIAGNPMILRAHILVDMLTALGIIFLGVMLYLTLRKQNETMALVGMAFYILEAALLAASRMATFSLLLTSQEYAAAGSSAHLLTMGSQALEVMDFGGMVLHMLVFGFGGLLFYYLLDKARIVPRVLSLWGLITTIPCLVATLLVIFGYEVPFAVYVPYAPFEFVIGIWILIKGVRVDSEVK